MSVTANELRSKTSEILKKVQQNRGVTRDLARQAGGEADHRTSFKSPLKRKCVKTLQLSLAPPRLSAATS